jgi:hypothetical protein
MCRLTAPLVLLVLLAALADAAPAPLPQNGTAEAVLGGSNARDPAAVRQLLLRQVVVQALRSDKVRRLNCLRGERDPSAWLAGRLKVEADPKRKGVRVRLEGCQPREALTLLSALVDGYAAACRLESREAQEYMLRRALVQQRLALQGAIAARAAAQEQRLREMEASLAVPAVIQAPKLVRSERERPREATPGR